MASRESNIRLALDKINSKVRSEEVDFLKYLIDCCENVLENHQVMSSIDLFNPVCMQLIKLRAEVTQRLIEIYGLEYGKFAKREHLLRR